MRSPWRSVAVGAPVLLSLTTIANAFAVTGATTGYDSTSKSWPARQNINDLVNSTPSWDLYILALQRFQNTSATDPLSYFQVAGIHGYPNRPWDGVDGTGSGAGFCMHSSVLFALWHRPYVALYEQIISYHAKAIAEEYPLQLRNLYQEAASTLRVPYWDWAITTGLPNVMTAATLPINTPDGQWNITNPLLQYTFPMDMLANDYFEPMSSAPNILQQSNTVRHYDPVTGQSNEAAAYSTLQASSAVRLSRVYKLLSEVGNYTTFSLFQRNSTNIEGIHGDVHNGVGGVVNGDRATGHMTIIPISAFDPAFWLHHANVDRLVALWQALHPDEYVQPTLNEGGTYYLPGGSIDTEDTPLAPFHWDNATTMWTAATARDTTAFGYTYPELLNTGASPSELKDTVTQRVMDLYAPPGTAFTNGTRHDRFRRNTNIAQAMNGVHADTALQLGVNNMDSQWYLRISIDAVAAESGAAVYLFVGQPVPDANMWPAASNLIGLHSPYFANSASEPSTLSQQIDIPCSHTIAAAVDRGILANLTPEVVVPFLKENVVVKAVGPNGSQLEVGSASGIQVSVLSRYIVSQKSLSEFPTYGTFEEHGSIAAKSRCDRDAVEQACEE